MKLFGSPGSTHTEKVLFAFAEKGQTVECIPVNLAAGDHRKPEHLSRHPFGVIPVLEDDGFWLYESRAIIQYLDARLPPRSLTPGDLKSHALMLQWLSVEQAYLRPAGVIRRHLLYAKFIGLTPDPQAVEQAKLELASAFDVIENALADRDYLVKDFSLAEISFMPELESMAAIPQAASLVTSRPRVNAWFQRIRQRPAWQNILEQRREAQERFARGRQ